MRLETDGLHNGRNLIARGEVEIYRALGLPFIDPELREGRGEIELALKGKLPKLVADKDLRGILHCHTDASDGTETLETMAKATRQRGFEYFGVADGALHRNRVRWGIRPPRQTSAASDEGAG
jgi:DNA polymerase (family 10)